MPLEMFGDVLVVCMQAVPRWMAVDSIWTMELFVTCTHTGDAHADHPNIASANKTKPSYRGRA
jgi:hypothetical protein